MTGSPIEIGVPSSRSSARLILVGTTGSVNSSEISPGIVASALPLSGVEFESCAWAATDSAPARNRQNTMNAAAAACRIGGRKSVVMVVSYCGALARPGALLADLYGPDPHAGSPRRESGRRDGIAALVESAPAGSGATSAAGRRCSATRQRRHHPGGRVGAIAAA